MSPGAAGAPRVAAVIVSWNSLALLPACLESLRGQTVAVDEILVVDNGSGDGTVAWLREQPDVRLLVNEENRGFAAANNQGIAATTAELVLLVNADVTMAADYIEHCLPHLDRPETGSVTGKLLRFEPPGTIDSTGHQVFGLGWTENRGEEQPDSGFDVAGEVFGVCAACAIYSRAALDSAAPGGEYFDESFASYIEDVDLDWRLRWLGWRAWYEPAAVATHHRSASGARRTARVMRNILRNRVLATVKNYDGPMLLRNAPGLALFTLTKAVDFARVHPSAALGLVDAARLLPGTLRRRRWLVEHRRARPQDVRTWLQPFPWRARLRRRLARRASRPA